MKIRLVKFFTAICMVLFVFGCGDGGGSSSDGTTDTDGTMPATAAKLDLTTDKYLLETDGLDSATLTIITRDASNAAVGNVDVNLSASAGFLSDSNVTTDSTGQANVTFSAGPEKNNQIANITATSGSISKNLPIKILGTILNLSSDRSSLLANAGDTAELTVAALDANDNPIPGAEITLTSAKGQDLTVDGITASTVTLTTDTNGKGTVTMTALDIPGIDTINASGLGAENSLDINITSARFGFTSPADSSTIAVSAGTELTVAWTDAVGAPASGQTLTFTTTGGYFDGTIGKTSTTATTGSDGTVTIDYNASTVASPVDINVTSDTESDTLRLLVASFNPARLDLQASPSVLAASIGGVDSSSTITASVRDANNQLVSNQTVIFTLEEGPGGGENLSPGTALTDAGGTASVTFTSGSAISAQEGVRIRATLQSDSRIVADTTLTIGQEAATIVLGGTNKISKVSVDGLEIGYAVPYSVLVVDNNGNPIPNARVNLGVFPLNFRTGGGNGIFKNEDQNRNGLLDPGEDGAKGTYDGFNAVWNSGSEGNLAEISFETNLDGTPNLDYPGIPNGKLDPGGVVSIPDSIVTDEDGLAAFEIKYAKAYGNWVEAEIMATTLVSGDLSTSKLIVFLSVMENDDPYTPSPFGQ